MLRRKERKKRKNRYAKLNRGRKRFIYVKINCNGKRTVGKANKGINVGKNNRFKKLKIKIEKRRKKREREENSTELQNPT